MSGTEKLVGTSPVVAYFSMEFCVDPNLPIYSGGLGVLAGDHLKAANDLDIPVVGVGIFYHQGYFSQKIREDGWQVEGYHQIDPKSADLKLLTDKQDQPVSVEVAIEDRYVKTEAYLKEIGSVLLLLLTTDVEGNSKEDRMITAHLYGATDSTDKQTRIRQEMILGIGGQKMLEKLGVDVGVYHMNEGHSAFLTIARLEAAMQEGLAVDEALELIRANQIFTSHTPVPAGHDIFPKGVLEKEFAAYLPSLGDGFTALRDRANHLENQPFDSWSQVKLARASAIQTNAVSRIHSETAATSWGQDQVDYITNGVHHSWIDDEIKALIDPDQQRFIRVHTDPDYLRRRMEELDPAEFRRLRNKKRRALVDFANSYLEKPIFDPDVLTIGYARRATSYKRLDLLFFDPDRLLSIAESTEYPAQIILAAKAHPHDEEGKRVIQRLVRTTRDPRFRDHMLFIPDYNSRIAHQLVTGSDVWVNTPQKYQEASGTSGMKNGMNGGKQFSVDAGWMNEVSDDLYFKIEDSNDPAVVAAHIYQILEELITPQFYNPNRKPLSDPWITSALRSMEYIIANFSASRMTKEYDSRFYQPLMRRVSVPA